MLSAEIVRLTRPWSGDRSPASRCIEEQMRRTMGESEKGQDYFLQKMKCRRPLCFFLCFRLTPLLACGGASSAPPQRCWEQVGEQYRFFAKRSERNEKGLLVWIDFVLHITDGMFPQFNTARSCHGSFFQKNRGPSHATSTFLCFPVHWRTTAIVSADAAH